MCSCTGGKSKNEENLKYEGVFTYQEKKALVWHGNATTAGAELK